MKNPKIKSRSRSVTDVFDNVTEEHRPDQQQDADDLSMEEAARDFAEGERVVKLYRTSETFGGRPKLLGGVPREDFNELNIQETFGGGRYFGRWKKKDGNYIRYTFDVAGPPKDPFKEDVKQVDPNQPQGYGFLKSNQPDNDDEDRGRSSGVSAVELLKLMAEVRRESREEMLMILDRFKPGPPPPDTTAQVFSIVEKIIPLMQAGGEGSGNPIVATLMTFKGEISQLVDGIHTALTKVPAQPSEPAPAGKRLEPRSPQEPLKPSPEPEPAPKEEGELFAESFRPHLATLCKAAREGKDVVLYHDLILDLIPPFAYDRLRGWLLKAGCLDQLEAVSPRPYTKDEREWFETLRGALIETLNEELGHGVRSIQPEPGTDPSDGDSTPGGSAA